MAPPPMTRSASAPPDWRGAPARPPQSILSESGAMGSLRVNGPSKVQYQEAGMQLRFVRGSVMHAATDTAWTFSTMSSAPTNRSIISPNWTPDASADPLGLISNASLDLEMPAQRVNPSTCAVFGILNEACRMSSAVAWKMKMFRLCRKSSPHG
ncbi:hypothetical protein BKA62DRAFT_367246 [Auriculariales sp. MPI-PUGE-AT-0066]|nr:hypothetical protein BKA62DRAFT_367246 [Auriculariales sp. MPI-PUGE-AT-0066]